MSAQLLHTLASTSMPTCALAPDVYTLSQMLMDTCDSDFGHWLQQAAMGGTRESTRENLKWKRDHKAIFADAGLVWLPVYSEQFKSMVAEAGMCSREAEVLHFHDRLSPVDLMATDDELLDLSQSLGRARGSRGLVPTIHPTARLWLRRRSRWLLAPEAVRCQGFDVPVGLPAWTHRQVFDLIGNSFHGDSCIAALVVALASAPSLQASRSLISNE